MVLTPWHWCGGRGIGGGDEVVALVLMWSWYERAREVGVGGRVKGIEDGGEGLVSVVMIGRG